RRLMVAVALPQLSLSMEEGKVLRWLVADGDRVRTGQPLVEIETDKATMEVEAPADGVVRIVAAEGATLAVEATLAEIADGGAEAKRLAGNEATVTDLLILAAVRALAEVPELNGTLGRPSAGVHLSLAVATAEGVVAPVIRDAAGLSLVQLTEERKRLV